MTRSSIARLVLPLLGPAVAGCSSSPGAGGASFSGAEVAMKPEEAGGYAGNPTKPFGALRQELTKVRVERQPDSRFAFAFSDGSAPTATPLLLKDVDLRWFVPRVPPLARGDATLARLALMQREYNRNETKFGALGEFAETKVANNCLRSGLWELVLEKKKDDGSNGMVAHGWFDFPEAAYAEAFEQANGVKFADYRAVLASYPAFGGFPVPLEKLRSVVAEKAVNLASVDFHFGDKLQRLPEQTRKAHLVLTPGIETYGDYAASKNQPIAVAEFSEPGFYNLQKPVKFDLSWLAQPAAVAWRRVTGVAAPAEAIEIELSYANGRRIVIGDAAIATLPVRDAAPTKDTETSRLTFGIGTPDIYASSAERKAEFEGDRVNWLLMLDRDGKNVDNHLAGVDRAFLWRTASALHVYLVGYERMTILDHVEIPWQAP